MHPARKPWLSHVAGDGAVLCKPTKIFILLNIELDVTFLTYRDVRDKLCVRTILSFHMQRQAGAVVA